MKVYGLGFWYPRNHNLFLFFFLRLTNHSNHIGQGCRPQVHCTARLSDSSVREQMISWLTWAGAGFYWCRVWNSECWQSTLFCWCPLEFGQCDLALVISCSTFFFRKKSCGYTYIGPIWPYIVCCSLNASGCILDYHGTVDGCEILHHQTDGFSTGAGFLYHPHCDYPIVSHQSW